MPTSITILNIIINRLGSTRFDLAPLGVATLTSLAWLGQTWLGFVRLGLAWLGFVFSLQFWSNRCIGIQVGHWLGWQFWLALAWLLTASFPYVAESIVPQVNHWLCLVWLDWTWLGLAWLAWLGLTWLGLALLGWLGLARLGMALPSFAWLGKCLAWRGQAWLGFALVLCLFSSLMHQKVLEPKLVIGLAQLGLPWRGLVLIYIYIYTHI